MTETKTLYSEFLYKRLLLLPVPFIFVVRVCAILSQIWFPIRISGGTAISGEKRTGAEKISKPEILNVQAGIFEL